ncbi:MAG: hypothetical protein FWE44_06130 [Defluviitaleaceae bacterium]|nr:hypothetical protein [Defluviitaleaceae bacterium]
MDRAKVQNDFKNMFLLIHPQDIVGDLSFYFFAAEKLLEEASNSKVKGKRNFQIKKEFDEFNVHGVMRPSFIEEFAMSATVYFPETNNSFKKRVWLAIGLAGVLHKLLIKSPFKPYGLNRSEPNPGQVLYFAKRLLQDRARECLSTSKYPRLKRTNKRDEIVNFIKEMFTFYNCERISEDTKSKIDKLLDDLKSQMPDDGYLDFEIRMAQEYIIQKHNLQKFTIRKRVAPADQWTKGSSRIFFHDSGERCDIYYSESNNPLEKRLLLGHELYHAVGHWSPSSPPSEDDCERAEATYFARLLLERKAEIILGTKESQEFIEAREEIIQSIKELFAGELWLNDVMA